MPESSRKRPASGRDSILLGNEVVRPVRFFVLSLGLGFGERDRFARHLFVGDQAQEVGNTVETCPALVVRPRSVQAADRRAPPRRFPNAPEQSSRFSRRCRELHGCGGLSCRQSTRQGAPKTKRPAHALSASSCASPARTKSANRDEGSSIDGKTQSTAARTSSTAYGDPRGARPRAMAKPNSGSATRIPLPNAGTALASGCTREARIRPASGPLTPMC